VEILMYARSPAQQEPIQFLLSHTLSVHRWDDRTLTQ
jgi:hypothetical protein